MKSIDVESKIKIDAYKVVSDSVESGVQYGWSRAHKYTENPDDKTVIEQIHNAVMLSLCEILKFNE